MTVPFGLVTPPKENRPSPEAEQWPDCRYPSCLVHRSYAIKGENMRGSARRSGGATGPSRRSGSGAGRARGAGAFAVVLLAGLLGPSIVTSSAAAGARTDTTAPVVTILSPIPGVAVSGSVVIAGTASDASGVRRVHVLVDSLPNPKVATGTTSWSFTLDTTRLTDGSHAIAAQATDENGNRATTTGSLTVANSSPSPSP